MKMLLTGAEGQFGRCFQDRSSDHTLIALSRTGLDISDLDAVQHAFDTYQPDVVVNGAAYTAVDRAEQEVELAVAVNRDGPQNLAIACAQRDIPLIHISTDYVFDGTATSPYLPNSPVSPLGVYGQSKWQGEEAIRRILDQHLIIRTAWVFSEYGNNFVKTMLRLGADREELSVVADQVGCPTYAGHIADAIVALMPLLKLPDFDGWGTYHFAGDQAISWHGFARRIFEAAVRKGILPKQPMLHAITTAEYPTLAQRPGYSVLDSTAIAEMVGGSFDNDWKSSLEHVLGNI